MWKETPFNQKLSRSCWDQLQLNPRGLLFIWSNLSKPVVFATIAAHQFSFGSSGPHLLQGGIKCSKLRIFINGYFNLNLLIGVCWSWVWVARRLISENLWQTRAALMKWAERHSAHASLCNQRVNCVGQIWIIQSKALQKKKKKMDDTLKWGCRNIPQLHMWLGLFNQSNVVESQLCGHHSLPAGC